jgi:hypothetical protein
VRRCSAAGDCGVLCGIVLSWLATLLSWSATVLHEGLHRYCVATVCVLCAVFCSSLIAVLQHSLQRDRVAQVRRPEAAWSSCVLIWAEVCGGAVDVALHFRWRRCGLLAVGVAATCSNLSPMPKCLHLLGLVLCHVWVAGVQVVGFAVTFTANAAFMTTSLYG